MKKKSVLIIDDHEGLRKIIGRFLSKQYAVTTQPDGLSALAWMHQGNVPNLIILDMNMPGLTGFDFLSNLRSSGFFRSIPVVVVSAEEEPQLIDDCKKLKIQKYLTKPFNPLQLNDLIDSILLPNKHLNTI
ncbi:MAG: response regulator [Bacteroidota bacterium]